MQDSFGARLKHAWNAFKSKGAATYTPYTNLGPGYSYRPDRARLSYGNEKSTVASIYTRIAIDVAQVSVRHVRQDQNGRYLETINSGLNQCLSLEANIDQESQAFMRDVILSLFDEGVVAIVPVDTTMNPNIFGSYDIKTMRTGKILDWYPEHIRVSVYNEKIGRREDIVMKKSAVAIVENPLYSVMNEPNGTLKRLIAKINLLDYVDEQTSSGKLDLIIQLPYSLKTPARKEQAEIRRKDIEVQLSGSKYGIAYIDGTERVTQLNRPAENNLLKQVESLQAQLYNQLGTTESVFDGTADERTMNNYFARTIEPVLTSVVNEMRRKFLTKTARSQNQSIMFFRDSFKSVPVSELANIADKFTRNEILSSNELRAIIGYRPAEDPAADELRNKNLNPAKRGVTGPPPNVSESEDWENQNGV